MQDCLELRGNVFCFFSLLQQHIVNFPDNDMLQDRDTYSTIAPKSSGKVCSNVFNYCLKAYYATVTEVFFQNFLNVTEDHIM